MKRSLFYLALAPFFLTIPVSAFPANYSVDSATILRIEKRDIIGTEKQTLMPLTQFLGLDAVKLADGNLSLHFYGWGREDLADKSYNSSSAEGNLTYGYMQYRLRQANANIRAGRLFVHEGVANEHVDGLSVRTDLPLGFALSAFGGAMVHTGKLYGENSDGKGDSIFGGRVNYRYKGVLEAGISGLYESKAPVMLNYINGNHRLLGGDIRFSPHRMFELMGQSSYNTETSQIAAQNYLLNFKPVSGLILTSELNEQNDRSNQYSWTMFSRAKLNPDDMSRSAGISASCKFNKYVDLSLDYKHYRREIGTAERYGVNAGLSLLNNALRSGISYHILEADSGFATIGAGSSASYQELRAYAMHDGKSYFTSLDVIYFIFRERIYLEKSAGEVIASLGYHITPSLALSADLSYGRNPEFTEETKGLVRLTYNMTTEDKGGKK